MDVYGFLHDIKWIVFHGHLDYFPKTHFLKVGLTQNRETMALWTLKTVDFILYILSCVRTHMNRNLFIEIKYGWGPGYIWLHTIHEDPWPHYTLLKVSCDGLWTLSFGLSQFHGHNSCSILSCVRTHTNRNSFIEITYGWWPGHIWLQSSHYTWGSVTTLHDFEGVLGRSLDTFFWALTIILVTALGSCVKGPQLPVSLAVAAEVSLLPERDFWTAEFAHQTHECPWLGS